MKAVDLPKPREPIAVIGGETLYDDDLSSMASQLQQLRKQEYDLKLNAIENLLFPETTGIRGEEDWDFGLATAGAGSGLQSRRTDRF